MNQKVDEVATTCLSKQLRAITRVVTGIYDRALRPHGLKTSQLNVLVAIASAKKIRPSHLVKVLHLDKSTLSRNIEKMERQGWVHIDETGRSQTLSLTTAGQKLVQASLGAWEQAQQEASALLGASGAKAITKISKQLDERSAT